MNYDPLLHPDADLLKDFVDTHALSMSFLQTAQQHFIGLSEALKRICTKQNKPLFVAINGCQGSGKSTLAAFIQAYLKHKYSLNIVFMSLDDFYLSQVERIKLASKIHPLFKTRGVPGTHDIQLATQVLIALKSQQKTLIPRFNKATDNPKPQQSWTQVSAPADIVIFEGWCWGVSPQSPKQLLEAVNQLERVQDDKGVWRNYVNQQLAKYYQPLYCLFDQWIMLKAPSFDHVYHWRLEQEQKLQVFSHAKPEEKFMDAKQIQAFILHYQRLTEHAIDTLPVCCDFVFALDESRKITAAKMPSIS